MFRSWTGSMNGNDIELRVGTLRSLFLSNGSNAKAAIILACVTLMAAAILFVVWLIDPASSHLIVAWGPALIFSGIVWAVWWYYRNARSYFAICTEGCAYGSSMQAAPVTIPWNELHDIRLSEEASLKTEESTFLGLKMATTLSEVNHRTLHLQGKSDQISFKLNAFPRAKQLLDALVESTSDKNINLDHAKAESEELVAAKQAGQEQDFGKRQMTVIGIVLVVIFIVLRVVVKMNR
jgi:hypothetical protein